MSSTSDLGRGSDWRPADGTCGGALPLHDWRGEHGSDDRGGSARNFATNALAASGYSSASSGPAVSTSLETMIPLSAFAKYVPGHTPLSVNHQGM